MSENSASLVAQTKKKEERALNLLEQIVLGSKIATGLLAFTYVSGYLISTTYLSTYGISADASELLRAKYIYIGFLYGMCVIAFGVVARVVAVALESPKVSPSDRSGEKDWIDRWKEDDADDAERYQARNALKMRSMRGSFRNRRGHFRHVRLAALILSLFVIEIMLVKPGSFFAYLPLQTIFLLSIVLYQTTFYREYSSRSYGWGTVYGKDSVERMRSLYGIKIGFLIVLLMLGKWLSDRINVPFLLSGTHSAVHWIARILLWSFAIAIFAHILGGGSFVALRTEALKSLDLRKRLRHSKIFPMLGLLFALSAVRPPILYLYRILLRSFAHPIKRILNAVGLRRKLSVPKNSKPPNNEGGFRRDLRRSSLRRFVARLCMWQKYLSSFNAFRWENVTVPILSSAFCFLALWVLLGEHLLLVVATLDYGALVLALIILSNLLVLSYMHYKKHRDLEVKYSIDWHTWVLIGVEGGILYLVSVFGFSYLVYPFLPLEKAGGEYLKEYAITVSLNHGELGCSSTALDTTFESQPLSGLPKGKVDGVTKEQGIRAQQQFVVLEEGSNWSYLAPSNGPDAGGGPDAWKWWALCDEYYSDAKPGAVCRPRVYAVNRRCIADTKSIEPQ